MRVVRSSVFETNSSSSHTLSVNNKFLNRYVERYKYPISINSILMHSDKDEKLPIRCGDYGWGLDIISGDYEKLCLLVFNYIINDSENDNYKINIKDILLKYIKDRYNCDIEILNNGSIDHESFNVIHKFLFSDKFELNEKLIYATFDEFINNNNIYYVVFNDNESSHVDKVIKERILNNEKDILKGVIVFNDYDDYYKEVEINNKIEKELKYFRNNKLDNAEDEVYLDYIISSEGKINNKEKFIKLVNDRLREVNDVNDSIKWD